MKDETGKRGRATGTPSGGVEIRDKVEAALVLATGNRMTVRVLADTVELVQYGERLLASSAHPARDRVVVRPTPPSKLPAFGQRMS